MIIVGFWDHDGSYDETRFEHEIDAIHFEEGLDCEGLSHDRVVFGVFQKSGKRAPSHYPAW